MRGTSRAAEATDAGCGPAGWLWVGFSMQHTFAKRAHGAPKTFGIRQKSPARAVAVQFPGQTLHEGLAAPLAPFFPNSPLSVTAWAFPSVSSCTIWVLFKAQRPILGAFDTSSFSTGFPALLQPYDSTMEQGPHAAGFNPASLQGPTASPLIPRVLCHLGTMRPAPALTHVPALCSGWACGALVGSLDVSG